MHGSDAVRQEAAPGGEKSAAPSVTVDGIVRPDGTVRLADDGVEHRVEVAVRAARA
jgi:hypothetical protein